VIDDPYELIVEGMCIGLRLGDADDVFDVNCGREEVWSYSSGGWNNGIIDEAQHTIFQQEKPKPTVSPYDTATSQE